MSRWWYHEDAHEVGPFSTERIHQLILVGRVEPGTYLRRDNEHQWLPIELFSEFDDALKNFIPSGNTHDLENTQESENTSDESYEKIHREVFWHPMAYQPMAGGGRRFVARMIDLYANSVFIMLFMAMIVPLYDKQLLKAIAQDKSLMLCYMSFFILPLAMLMDAAICTTCENSFGKWLLSVQVLNASQRRLSFKQLLIRNVLVLAIGLAMGIKVLSTATAIWQFNRLRQGKRAIYDEWANHDVHASHIPAWRKLLGVLTLAFTLISCGVTIIRMRT